MKMNVIMLWHGRCGNAMRWGMDVIRMRAGSLWGRDAVKHGRIYDRGVYSPDWDAFDLERNCVVVLFVLA